MICRLLSIASAALMATIVVAAATPVASASGDNAAVIPEISDIRIDAADARSESGLIVVIATFSDCHYCEVVKEEILQPLLLSGELDGVAVVREIAMDGIEIKDFAGKRQDPGRFADEYGAQFSPTVFFLSPAGEALHPPIVGVQSIDFYGFYLEKAIAKAHKALGLGS